MNLLAALVDDAGLFPPESLPMAEALTRHRADEAAGHLMLSGRFLCRPATTRVDQDARRLTELVFAADCWARISSSTSRSWSLPKNISP